ncbi:ABC transporter ATP-binding protein [Promicromonospora sp. NPDC057138]|uniref:ABC transporter ATP-binding protein n=1 Tax=Promicromonospora sp. NPDC057138 TaxID=3346031 RepID=UPI003637A61B
MQVKGIKTRFGSDSGSVVAVDEVSFDLERGETICLVGESGSGKSVTALSIMGLLPRNGRVTDGEILFEDRNLLELSEPEMREHRGNSLAMIFQEPMTSLNPVLTIGDQLTEGMLLHLGISRQEAADRAVELLELVGVPRAGQIVGDYPHRLSGGMRQRVMIAMALSCSPVLLIADEPTTALDVTIQAQILTLMKKLAAASRTATILITHDLGVVAEMADKVAVMYAGQVVEEADVFELFDHPKHPYTVGLMKSIPHLGADDDARLESIPGSVPALTNMPSGCRFQDRCPSVMDRCRAERPGLLGTSTTAKHLVRCFLYDDEQAAVRAKAAVVS